MIVIYDLKRFILIFKNLSFTFDFCNAMNHPYKYQSEMLYCNSCNEKFTDSELYFNYPVREGCDNKKITCKNCGNIVDPN